MRRLPEPVKGCLRCRSLNAAARFQRVEVNRAQRVLVRHGDGQWAQRYHDEARAAVARADDQDSRYEAHHAEEHPIPAGQVVLPPTDNDRAPSYRKPVMPLAADLAARLRAGENLEVLSAEYERTPAVVSRRISQAGFHGVTGEPRLHAGSGAVALARRWDSRPWLDDAVCAQVDGEIFFPDPGGSTREAKSICAVCPAREPCLQDALTNNDHFGVRGGLSERERRKLKKAAS